jgi:hypothetical protein
VNGAFLLPLMPLTKLDLVKEDEFFITSGKTLLLSIFARADCCEILLFVSYVVSLKFSNFGSLY